MSPNATACRILFVEDDDTFRRVMSAELVRQGHEVIAVETGRAALERAAEIEPDIILLDLRLPDYDGIDVLQRLAEKDLAQGVIVLTGHGSIDTAIRAVRLGAQDYLEKPCPAEKVEMAIRKTQEHNRLRKRQRILQDGYTLPALDPELIGTSPEFVRLKQMVARVAAADSTTLIVGETGTGKEIVSRLLHRHSSRKDAPFVVVDCAGLQEELLQSELFGHEKGAFTGAARQKHGLFEVADGGTIFLDEVGEASLEIQAKLLRVLETGRFRHVGGTREIAVDVRVVSATNRDLNLAVAERRFREDLYFRLATLTIEIPPLRDRTADIPVLLEHFTARFNSRFSLSKRFSDGAEAALCAYAWPGNVRELIHVVEQSIVLAEGDTITAENLPPQILSGPSRRPVQAAPEDLPPLQEVQRRHVAAVMEHVGGNRAEAARVLGISERNLYRLLKKASGEQPHS
ncbi:MAG: sigma-54-dependent transcriptional regulator [Planctomycetota bacterium]